MLNILKFFLCKTQNLETTKEKVDWFDYINIKNFWIVKEAINKG